MKLLMLLMLVWAAPALSFHPHYDVNALKANGGCMNMRGLYSIVRKVPAKKKKDKSICYEMVGLTWISSRATLCTTKDFNEPGTQDFLIHYLKTETLPLDNGFNESVDEWNTCSTQTL